MNGIHCKYECHLVCEESKGCRSPNVWLAKVEGLTFIPIKVRLFLFKDIIIFIF